MLSFLFFLKMFENYMISCWLVLLYNIKQSFSIIWYSNWSKSLKICRFCKLKLFSEETTIMIGSILKESFCRRKLVYFHRLKIWLGLLVSDVQAYRASRRLCYWSEGLVTMLQTLWPRCRLSHQAARMVIGKLAAGIVTQPQAWWPNR